MLPPSLTDTHSEGGIFWPTVSIAVHRLSPPVVDPPLAQIRSVRSFSLQLVFVDDSA